jgi:uncharacterized iron-regulated membrane protein
MARELHRVIGFSLAGCWALLLVTGLTVVLRRRDAGRLYWGDGGGRAGRSAATRMTAAIPVAR